MKNYIILRGGIREHYYTNNTGGIYCHTMKNGFWTSPLPVDSYSVGDFGLFEDENEYIHIVSRDQAYNIIYTLIRGKQISHYTILSGKQNVTVSDFRIKAYNGFLNLFYIAEADDEKMLIHCILGNNSQPSVVSKLITNEYFLRGSRVYFTNENSVLGYTDFSDGATGDFVPRLKNAVSLYICGSESEHMTWKCGDDIILDGSVVFTDKDSSAPIIIDGEHLTLMWESNGIINYISDKTASKHNTPMRFISTGKTPVLFCVQNYNEFEYFYGNYSGNEVNIFGKSNIFERHIDKQTASQSQSSTDIQRLKIMIDMIQKEVNSIKNQISFIKQLYEK